LTKTSAGNDITSTIAGENDNRIFKIDYHISVNENWETTFASIRTKFDSLVEFIKLEKRDGKYLLNGEYNAKFDNISDIDISATPFTNTLPINRLQLKVKERQVIEVIYFDIFEKEIRIVKQIYTRLTGVQYVYENYDGSFKANLVVDEHGLVVEYPELFEMVSKRQSNYSQHEYLQ
jgi:hypothetical protein